MLQDTAIICVKSHGDGGARACDVVVVVVCVCVCHYSHKLTGPPIISWPKLSAFSGDRSLKFWAFQG
jgi:hypothetical protein